jgi:hypothetical protein
MVVVLDAKALARERQIERMAEQTRTDGAIAGLRECAVDLCLQLRGLSFKRDPRARREQREWQHQMQRLALRLSIAGLQFAAECDEFACVAVGELLGLRRRRAVSLRERLQLYRHARGPRYAACFFQCETRGLVAAPAPFVRLALRLFAWLLCLLL